jgi:hypothetical protein
MLLSEITCCAKELLNLPAGTLGMGKYLDEVILDKSIDIEDKSVGGWVISLVNFLAEVPDHGEQFIFQMSSKLICSLIVVCLMHLEKSPAEVFMQLFEGIWLRLIHF